MSLDMFQMKLEARLLTKIHLKLVGPLPKLIGAFPTAISCVARGQAVKENLAADLWRICLELQRPQKSNRHRHLLCS